MRIATILAFGLIAAAANVAGGLWLTSRKGLNKLGIHLLVALGAGFMLAAVFVEVMPEALELWPGGSRTPWVLLLCGYLLV